MTGGSLTFHLTILKLIEIKYLSFSISTNFVLRCCIMDALEATQFEPLPIWSFKNCFIGGMRKIALIMGRWHVLIHSLYCLSTDTMVDQYRLAVLKLPVRTHIMFGKNEYPLRPNTISDDWKPLKNDSKCCYFMLKPLFVLKIFKFFS